MSRPRVDNDLYRRKGGAWWDDDCGEFSTIRFFVNPIRYGYFRRMLEREGVKPSATLLDVGCGGGILAEEFARDGFRVTGIDPAPESVATAQVHAVASGLEITYQTGSGEHLSFPEASFDLVTCCDVLEHVDDVGRVIGEIARVMKPDGLFFYDTINRTCTSWIGVIKIMQDWPSTAYAAPNSHVWHKFIKPRELARVLRCHDLRHREMRGMSIRRHPVAALFDFRRRARGEITFRDLGERLGFQESRDLSVCYMGYAARRC